MNEAQYYNCQKRKLKDCDTCLERFKCWTSRNSLNEELEEMLKSMATIAKKSMLSLDEFTNAINALKEVYGGLNE